ncbi:MAG: adenylyl-sulfate kinase, partial [Candidatus Hydrogenedentota bacterium]
MAELAQLVAAMSRPEFYSHPVRPPIQVRQTHISYVFLTGDFAYKIKKPVDFGFLDFSTLEQRRHFCEEELRLNRIFAPALYVDVLPIYKRTAQFSFSPAVDSDIVEYALRMRQFREEDLWENVFDRGGLGDSHVTEITGVLVQLHAKARADEYVAQFGAPRLVRKVAEETFLQVSRNVGHLRNADFLRPAEAFAERFLQVHAGLFQRRVNEKRIRECHGDLHLRNICFFEGAIQLFDRIEFNEEFRNIDVVYDLAFLVMDLADRGRRDLANLLWNTYVEESGDYEGALLMRFYAMMRALIRVKVLLLQYR